MMRLKIPMTGTVVDFDPECYKLDSIGISGDNNDPVRVVNLNLGGIAWRLVSVDLENDLMEVEAEAPDKADFPVLDTEGKPVMVDGKLQFLNRSLIPDEKAQVLANAQNIIESHTADEIYSVTKDKRLVKTAEVMEKYNKAKEARGKVT